VKEAITGLERVRQAIAISGGYEWCDEHRRIRWWGEGSCDVLGMHPEVPDLPAYCFTCEREHEPMEWGDGCFDDAGPLAPRTDRPKWWQRILGRNR